MKYAIYVPSMLLFYFIFINSVLSGIGPFKGPFYLNVTPQQSATCMVFVLFVFVWYIVVAFSTL